MPYKRWLVCSKVRYQDGKYICSHHLYNACTSYPAFIRCNAPAFERTVILTLDFYIRRKHVRSIDGAKERRFPQPAKLFGPTGRCGRFQASHDGQLRPKFSSHCTRLNFKVPGFGDLCNRKSKTDGLTGRRTNRSRPIIWPFKRLIRPQGGLCMPAGA